MEKNSNQVSKQPQSRTGSVRRIMFVFIGFVFSGFGLWYIFHDTDISELIDSVGRIRPAPLIAAVVLYWCVLVSIRSFLIRHLLRDVGTISWGKVYRYICIGYLANSVLPLRMGEVARISGIARTSGVSFVSVAGAAAVERLLDLAMATLIGIAAVQVAPVSEGIQLAVLIVGCGLAFVFVVFALLARRGMNEIPQSGQRRLKVLIWNLVVRFTSGLGALKTSSGVIRAAVFALLIWTGTIAVMLLRLAAFDLPATVPIVLVLLTSISLGVSLPSAPAYVGVYHAFTVGALTLFGIEEEVAVGFAIFCHFTDILPSVLFGMTSMLLEGLSFTDLRRTNTLQNQTGIGS
ncbi:MAG: flippase-like domain-containing protein [Proteobacteria bacterium]|nr:flippase-like domain-containing protein [Pseudomonadota bacterium]